MFFGQHTRIRLWLISSVIGILLASVISPFITSAFVFNQTLSDIAAATDIQLQEETVDGYRQIYTMVNDEAVFLTSGSYNHTQAMAAREYVVWVKTVNGAGQIVLYHIPTDTRLHLTETSTNQKPKVTTDGHVVWERWMEDRWQIFYFDGLSVRQMTEGDVSVDPDILNDTVVFTRQSSDGEWSAHKVELKSRSSRVLMRGFDAKLAKWEAGEVVFPVKRDREREEAKERRWKEILDAERAAQEEEKQALEAELKRRKEAEDYQKKRDGEEIEQAEQSDEETVPEPPLEPSSSDTTPTTTEVIVPEEVASSTTEETTPSTTEEIIDLTIEEESNEKVPEPVEPDVVTEDDIREELQDEPIVSSEFEAEETIAAPVVAPVPEVASPPPTDTQDVLVPETPQEQLDIVE